MSLTLIGVAILLLFLFPWGGIVVGLVGIVLLALTLVGWIARPASRGRA